MEKKDVWKWYWKSIDNKVWINNDMYISTLIWNEHLFFIFSHETGEDMQNIGIFSIFFLVLKQDAIYVVFENLLTHCKI